MKKTLIISSILLILILISLFFINTKENKDVIKIGVVASLTGPGAAFGQSAVKSIELAQKDLQDTKHTYEILVEDDEGNPTKSASAAQKLINIDKVDAIISVSSGAGNAVKPIAEQAGIPHISNASDLSIADTKTGFIISLLPDDEAQKWLQEAKENNVKTIAILSQNHPGVNITMEYIKKYAGDYEITVVYDEQFDSQTRDFKTSVAKAKQTSPDLYMVAMFPPLLEIVSKELFDQGQTNVSSYAMIGASTDPQMFEGKWYTDSMLSDSTFVEKFKKEFPEIRFNVRTAPANYDAIIILIEGFEQNKNIIEYLENLKEYSGKSGELTQTQKHVFRIPASIWSIKDGQPVIVK